MQKTLGFYNDILASMRYSADDEGLISITSATGVPMPALVEEKRLVLPTKEWLKKGFDDSFQAFHPLAETMARRGTSPVLQHMQRNARAQLSFTYIFLAQQLLRVAADRDLHKELPMTEDCSEFLKRMQTADAKLVKIFDQLVAAANQKNRVITVYLKNGGSHEGKKVNRLAVIRFPLIEVLETDEPKVLGIDIKPKQRQALLTLLRTILPNGDDPEQYSAGSNNRVAPYLHAFLQAYLKVITQLNRIINRYSKPMALPVKPFPTYDEEILSEFSEIYDEIPSLAGNEGEVQDTGEEPTTTVHSEPVKPKTIPVQGVLQSPVNNQMVQASPMRAAAVREADDDTMSFEQLKASMQPQQQQVQMPGYPALAMGGMAMAPQPGHVVLPWQAQMTPMVQQNNPFAGVAAQHNMTTNMPNVPYGMGNSGMGMGTSTIIGTTGYQVGMGANTLV